MIEREKNPEAIEKQSVHLSPISSWFLLQEKEEDEDKMEGDSLDKISKEKKTFFFFIDRQIQTKRKTGR